MMKFHPPAILHRIMTMQADLSKNRKHARAAAVITPEALRRRLFMLLLFPR